MFNKKFFVLLAGLALVAGAASAEVLELPANATQQTELSADVSEQADVSVPASVSFDVPNIAAASTSASATAPIEADYIVLGTATKQLQISVKAGAAKFMNGAAEGWPVTKVHWTTTVGTNWEPEAANDTLDNADFVVLGACTADAASCDTGVDFTLDAETSIKRSGNYTLDLQWKFESIGA